MDRRPSWENWEAPEWFLVLIGIGWAVTFALLGVACVVQAFVGGTP